MTEPQDTPVFTVGTTVSARPWLLNEEHLPRGGLVIGHPMGEHLLVWFPSLGELCHEEDGYAVQAIIPGKAHRTGHITDWPLRRLQSLQKRVIRGGGHNCSGYVLSAISVAAMHQAAARGSSAAVR